MAARTRVNREIQGFAFAWTGITLIIGIATFFGIYLTYDASADNPLDQGVSIPQIINANTNTDPEPEAPAIAAAPTELETSEPEPTDIPPTPLPETEEPEGISVAQAVDTVENEARVAQEQTDPEPTALPVNVNEFEVGIQVQYSINFDPNTQNAWMNDVEGLGLGWMKQQVRWDEIEIARDEYDWRKLDLALPIASERGIKVVLSVLSAPAWSRAEGVNLEEVGPPANYQDFVDFLVAMIERYPGQIHGIEVWNEQNIAREWTTPNGLSAADYVTMLRQAYTGIKNADPGIIVISGALSPTGLSDGINAIDDFQYMDQMIEVGLLNYADCIGAHHNGYNIGPSVTWDNVPNDPNAIFRGPFDNPHHSWSLRSTLQTYANKVAVAGGDQKLCVTEFGWASVEDLGGEYPPGFEFALDNTLEEQAEWTAEALQNMAEWDIVRLAIIWNLNYGPQIGWDATNDNTPYSLIGPDWAKRPAYDAIREWALAREETTG